jgi:hypothetical protein
MLHVEQNEPSQVTHHQSCVCIVKRAAAQSKIGCFVVMVKLKLLQISSRLVWPYDSFHLLFWNFRASFFTSEGKVPYRSLAKISNREELHVSFVALGP